MKKSCNECKASGWGLSHWGRGFGCRLGYSVDFEKGIPLEECPKPMRIHIITDY